MIGQTPCREQILIDSGSKTNVTDEEFCLLIDTLLNHYCFAIKGISDNLPKRASFDSIRDNKMIDFSGGTFKFCVYLEIRWHYRLPDDRFPNGEREKKKRNLPAPLIQFYLNTPEFHGVVQVSFFPERVGEDEDGSGPFGSHDIRKEHEAADVSES